MSLNLILHGSLFLALFASTNAVNNFRSVAVGRCPRLPPVPGFSMKKFSGVWYPLADYSSQYRNCQQLNISATTDHDMEIDLTYTTNPATSFKFGAEAFTANASNPGFLYWTWNAGPSSIMEEFTVLDTNYGNYSVIFLCYDFRLFHKKSFVILSRDMELNDIYYNKGEDVFALYHYRRGFRHLNNDCYRNNSPKEITLDNEIQKITDIISNLFVY